MDSWTVAGSSPAINDPAGDDTIATAINSAGQVIGTYCCANGSYISFLDSGGTFTSISDPLATGATDAEGINNSGQIVGLYFDGSGEHGFVDNNGVFTTVDDPLGGDGTIVSGINDLGQIVGYYVDSSGIAHGFVASDWTFTTIDDPFGSGGSSAYGINDAGQITGSYDTADGVEGFLATPTSAPEPSTLAMGLAAFARDCRLPRYEAALALMSGAGRQRVSTTLGLKAGCGASRR